MIASARLRGAQNRVEEARPFASGTLGTLSAIKGLEQPEASTVKNLLIAVTSDRGLCGSINSQVVKATRAYVDNKNKGTTRVVVVGDKGTIQLVRTHPASIDFTVNELSKGASNFFAISLVVDKILASPTAGDFDNVFVLYNKFNSVISFTPTLRHVPSTKILRVKVEQGMAELDDFEFEDDFKVDHLADLAQYHLAVTLYSALLENQTSELGARMTSMDTATTNASDMIKRLTIKYNRGRQATITTELNEVKIQNFFILF